jgi:L-2-hydroxyglutarate oxidase LhgO
MIDGNVECGPNAVLALAREGYSWKHFSSKELAETLLYPGFVKLALKHGGTGIYEVLRSLNKRMFLSSVQNLIPDIREEDITPGGSGVRAQAVSSDGKLVDDFYFVEKKNQLHVLNAPSPAATSCLSIGQSIVTKLATAAPDIF